MAQGVPGSADLLEQLTDDVQSIRRALEDARANVRKQPLTSEAACNHALDRLYQLERRFPQLQEMLRRREKARQQQTTDQRIRQLEQELAAQRRELDAVHEQLRTLNIIDLRKHTG
jgi:Mg2+ and Co2+ transporter CorA